jgi:Holliday junction resolvase-like predicted endonuclease
MRAGASKDAAKRILKKIRGHIYRGSDTRDIYKMVLTALSEEKEGSVLKQRYQLKDAIMRLGHAGFMFENYVGEILKHSGFKIKKIRGKVRGECTVHEIDLIVFTKNKRILVECKYHSKHGAYTGLKESLYTHARFLDTKSYFDKEYLICNTKVSTHAKKYAKCVAQQILSWRYPPNNSLENIIEKNHLYPITILNLNSKELEIFSYNGIMLAKNLLNYSEYDLSKKTGINIKRIRNFQKLTQKIIS